MIKKHYASFFSNRRNKTTIPFLRHTVKEGVITNIDLVIKKGNDNIIVIL